MDKSRNSDRIRVLIVEDENIIALDIHSILENLGFEVCGIVSSGEQSVELAFKQRPDLVLMDIRLKGGMSGLEAAEIIHHKYKIPIIYITAYGDELTLEKAIRSESVGFITKPFEVHELKNAIKAILEDSNVF